MLTPLRRGLSLIELLVVIALLGVAGGALARIAISQQRRYRALAVAAVTHGQLREGADILASELAGIAPALGDIHDGEMLGASIAFRSPLGTWLLCSPPGPGSSQVDLVALPLVTFDSVQRDAVADAPAVGDSLWMLGASVTDDSTRDEWSSHVVTSASSARTACAPSADSGEVAVHRLTISPQPPPDVARNAPVRTFRRARYALYRSADGMWYLGFSDCLPIVRTPACAPLQPVSGPYAPYAAAGADPPSGIVFRYLDRGGADTDDRRAVAAIEVTLRPVAGEVGAASGTPLLRRTIVLRNASR